MPRHCHTISDTVRTGTGGNILWDPLKDETEAALVYLDFLSSDAQLEEPFIEEEVGLAALDFTLTHRLNACVTDVEPGSSGWLCISWRETTSLYISFLEVFILITVKPEYTHHL